MYVVCTYNYILKIAGPHSDTLLWVCNSTLNNQWFVLVCAQHRSLYTVATYLEYKASLVLGKLVDIMCVCAT